MEKSIFIKTLEYGEKTGLDGTTWPLFKKWAVDNRLIESEKENGNTRSKKAALKRIFTECFEKTGAAEQNQIRCMLKPEYYLKLMEYRELKAAKDSAATAGKNAYKAIIFAVSAILISVVMGMTIILKPVSIPPEKLSALIESIKCKEIQTVEVSKLQMAQILAALESTPQQPVPKPVMQKPSSEDSMIDAINRYYEQ